MIVIRGATLDEKVEQMQLVYQIMRRHLGHVIPETRYHLAERDGEKHIVIEQERIFGRKLSISEGRTKRGPSHGVSHHVWFISAAEGLSWEELRVIADQLNQIQQGRRQIRRNDRQARELDPSLRAIVLDKDFLGLGNIIFDDGGVVRTIDFN